MKTEPLERISASRFAGTATLSASVRLRKCDARDPEVIALVNANLARVLDVAEKAVREMHAADHVADQGRMLVGSP